MLRLKKFSFNQTDIVYVHVYRIYSKLLAAAAIREINDVIEAKIDDIIYFQCTLYIFA